MVLMELWLWRSDLRGNRTPGNTSIKGNEQTKWGRENRKELGRKNIQDVLPFRWSGLKIQENTVCEDRRNNKRGTEAEGLALPIGSGH